MKSQSTPPNALLNEDNKIPTQSSLFPHLLHNDSYGAVILGRKRGLEALRLEGRYRKRPGSLFLLLGFSLT